MKTKIYSNSLALATAASLVFGAAISASAQDGAAPDQEAMMKAYIELIAPGPQHKQLTTLVGEWKTLQKLWTVPGAPPMENPGTAKYESIMEGRYLLQTYKSAIQGMGPYQGRGTTAYDKVTKEYVNTWIDSLSTGIMVSKGKATDAKTVKLNGEVTEPFTNAKVKYRTVLKFIDDDNHEMEMYEIRGENERKLMHITYKRTKGSGKAEKKEK